MNLYPFIEVEKTQQHNVKRTCELLEVSRAAYYANRADSPGAAFTITLPVAQTALSPTAATSR